MEPGRFSVEETAPFNLTEVTQANEQNPPANPASKAIAFCNRFPHEQTSPASTENFPVRLEIFPAPHSEFPV
jgi:hypothetical protein